MVLPANAKITIVGSGVGGLATAHALIHRKVRPENIRILERSPVLKPQIGGGFSLQSGAIVLRKFGLGAKLNDIAHPISHVVQYGKGGQLLGSMHFHESAQKNGVQFQDWMAGAVMRADLLNILADSLPPGILQLGKNVVGCSQTNDKVTLQLENGETIESDLVVAADGIKSFLRKQVIGPDAPHFAKEAMWFGVSNWKPTGKYEKEVPNTMVQLFGKASYSGYYPCGNKGEIIFWNVSPSQEILEENWEMEGAKNKILQIAKEKNVPDPFPAIVENATRIMHFGMYFRDPVPASVRWHKGRVVVVGDAMHATLPYLGQGANQAIEDAAFLAKSLTDPKFSTIEEALVGYHQARHKKVFDLVKGANVMGKLELAKSDIGTTLRDFTFKLANKSGQLGNVFVKIWKQNAEDAAASVQ